MPNHVTTIIEIESLYADEDQSDYEEQKAKIKKLYKEPHTDKSDFDFNALIPMPKELSETAADPDIFDTQEEVDKRNAKWRETWKNDKHMVEQVKAITTEEAKRREKEYGYHTSGGGIFRERTEPILDWYEWSIEKWGTKWNAYDVVYLNAEDADHIYGSILVKIETAWSPPLPVLEALAARGFRVTYTCKDEGWDHWNNWEAVQALAHR